MRKFIVLLLVVCCSCSSRIQPVAGGPKVKEKKPVATIMTFTLVGSFLLGYCITDEYIREK